MSYGDISFRCIPAPNKNDINFITLARLSPEKNQQNLIKAFKDIVNINRNCKLFILGDGPLYGNLKTNQKFEFRKPCILTWIY